MTRLTGRSRDREAGCNRARLRAELETPLGRSGGGLLTKLADSVPDKHQVSAGDAGQRGKLVRRAHPADVTRRWFWEQVGGHRCFTIVTCDPNELVSPIRRKAMIRILEEANGDRWRTCGYANVLALQRPYPAEKMTMRCPILSSRKVPSA